MDSQKKKVGFLLTPEIQGQVIEIAEALEQQGITITNEIFMGIVQQLQTEGKVLKAEGNQIQEMVGKLVPKGGKILHVRPEEDQS